MFAHDAYEHTAVVVTDGGATERDTGSRVVADSKRAINRAVGRPDLESAREIEAEIWWEQFATEERRRLVDAFDEECR